MHALTRRRLLALTPLPIIGLSLTGCQSNGTNPPPSLNKIVFAAQSAAAVLFKTASVLVKTCVIDKTSNAGKAMDASFVAVMNTFDSVNASLQAGAVDAANLALSTALVALQEAQIAFQKLQLTAPQQHAVRMATPKAAAGKKGFAPILILIAQFLPIILSSLPDIVNLVKSFIGNTDAPEDVTLAAVQQSNDSMHDGIVIWSSAVCGPE